MNSKNRIPVLIFTVHIILLFIYHIFGYIGHFGFDDLHYSQLSIDLTKGIVDYNDHFTFRFPVIILSAFSYFLFGVSDFSSSIPSLLITVFILLLVFLTLKNKSFAEQIIGQALTLFSGWFIFYSDKLMPDIYVALSVILSLYILHKYKYRSYKQNTFLYSVLLSLSLIFGFMAKGTIVLFLPLLIYFATVDFILKRDLKFWFYSVISGIFTLTVYFLIIWLFTGDLSKRFDAIANNNYLNLCSYNQQPFHILLKRITYDFFKLLAFQGMFIPYVLFFAFIIKNNIKSYFLFNDSFSFYLVASIVLLLSSNFMTVSFTSYAPMCLDPRHYLFLVPVSAIPASGILINFTKNRQLAIPIILCLIPFAIWSYFLPGESFYTQYLPLSVLFILFIVLKKGNFNQVIFRILFVAILFITPFKAILHAQKVNYKKQKDIVITEILEKHNNSYVVTNEVQKRLGNYYCNFNKKYNVTFLSYDEFKSDTLKTEKKLLLLNWYTRYLSNMNFEDLPYYARNVVTSNPVIYENKALNISIYALNQVAIPTITGTKIVRSQNNFEQSVPFWNQNENDISERIVYDGKKSFKVPEYSATFSYPIDSIPISNFIKIVVSGKLMCNFYEETDSKIVVSCDNQSGSYFWKGQETSKFIKAYSNWWTVPFEVELQTSELQEGSMLNVYLWNTDKKTVYIDNFEVNIIGMTDE